MKYLIITALFVTVPAFAVGSHWSDVNKGKKVTIEDVKSNLYQKANEAIDGSANLVKKNKDGIERGAQESAPKIAQFVAKETKQLAADGHEVIKEVKSSISAWKLATYIGIFISVGGAAFWLYKNCLKND